MKSKKGAAKCECVKVAIRVRPMNKHEIEQKSKLCVDVDTTNNTVACTSDKNETKTFQFDYVYPMDTTQRKVYDEVAFPIVDSIFQGYNGTVFAYGQTGCGKTFTMMGVVKDENLRGIIPNAFSHIFGFIKTEESKRFLVRCSFVEIYNEEVRDLLGKSNQKLDIREDPKKGTFVKDLTYVTLKDTVDIENCLERGNKNRHVGATSMNDQSSRSHSLFTVYLEIEEKVDENNKKLRSGKLNLVDLAGSERVGKTNATGQTFDEGKKINLSLTALGSVIDALASNRKHIPYKDSKLTRLLADSLGGNTKTVMFANISPASYNYEETVGTLRYASRAKLIKNAPKINEDPKDALLRKYEEEIKALKEQLSGGNNNMNNNVNSGDNNDDNGENYNDFALVKDDPEKKQLLEKIAALEKDLIDNKKLEEADVKNNNNGKKINKEELEQKIKEENEKFKEYREQQLKQSEEMEVKLKKLEDEKKKEEELLKNDVDKLQKKIKELTSEMEDLKLDNSKDRNYYLEDVKAIYRDNQLYKEIIKYLLTDSELQKIVDLSKYNEEDEKWKVQPFMIKEKSLALPTVKFGQIGGGNNFNEIKNSKNNELTREAILDNLTRHNKKKNENNNNNTKQVIFQNYDDDNNNNSNNNDLNNNLNDEESYEEDDDDFADKNVLGVCDEVYEPKPIKLKLKDTKEGVLNNNNPNFDMDFNNKSDKRLHLIQPKDKILIDARRQAKSQVSNMRNSPSPDSQMTSGNQSNVNYLLMNKKEREKFEELCSGKLNTNIAGYGGNPLFMSAANNQMFKKGKQYGKVFLNPLSNANAPPPIIGNKKLKLAQIRESNFDNYDEDVF